MNCDQVLAHVLVGSYPDSVADVDRLRQQFGVTAVLNLQTDEDIGGHCLDWPRVQDHYRKSQIQLCRVPVRDFDPEELQAKLPECVAVLDRLLGAGHTVYLHCTAGAGRSPNTVIAYLHWVRHWDLDQAIQRVSGCRPCVPNPAVIRAAGKQFLNDSDHAQQDPP